jgi:DNA-directed RNA polymerase specialized sigma24 family protein
MVNLNRMRFLIGYEQRLRFDRLKKFARATKITTILTGMPRGSGTGNQTQDGAIELAMVDEAYREVWQELKTMREELEALLSSLDNPDDRGVMRLRYIDGWRLRDIPDAVHLSERAMYYHLASAERKLARMYPESVIVR